MEVAEQEAIFENAGQAVFVAYQIMSQEAMQDSPIRKALIRAMESIHLSPRQTVWLAALRGQKSETINFGGLQGADVRAQCVMVMQSLKSRLPAPEMWALQAKYGVIETETVQDDPTQPPRVRFAFSPERIEAIKGLSDWLVPSYPQIKPFAMDYVLGRIYADHKKVDISSRDLAKMFGGNHTMYLRATRKIKAQLRALEAKALARLEDHFSRQGVTPARDASCD